MQELLKRGVGVHHGGLLPILKEVVEILFSRGLVKVLFATETFAMGVNMPARTVVFNGMRKHDGREFRDLLPGEYTQMAGRAGRRGIDKIGTVIIASWQEVVPISGLRTMLTGSATKLESQFRLKYNMIINLLRVEDMSVEDMIKRSFSEFATQRALMAQDLPRQLRRLKRALARLDRQAAAEPCIRGELPAITDYYKETRRIGILHAQLLTQALRASKAAKAALGPGRLLLVCTAATAPADPLVDAPAVVLQGPESDVAGGAAGGRMGGAFGLGPAAGGAGGSALGLPDGGGCGARGDAAGAAAVVKKEATLIVLVLCPEGFTQAVAADTVTSGDASGAGAAAAAATAATAAAAAAAKAAAADPFAGATVIALSKTAAAPPRFAAGPPSRDDLFSSGQSFRRVGSGGGDSSAGGGGFGGGRGHGMKPGDFGQAHSRTYAVLEIALGDIVTVGKNRRKLDADAILSRGETTAAAAAVAGLVETEAALAAAASAGDDSAAAAFPAMDLGRELKVSDLDFSEVARELESTAAVRATSKCRGCPKLPAQYALARARGRIEAEIARLQHDASNESLALFPDFKQRLAVLRQLGYVDAANTVQLKGRVACEFNTCDELLATEMVLENVLAPLDPPEIAGVLSALIFQEKNSDAPPTMTPRLQHACQEVVDLARGLGQLQFDHGLVTDPEDVARQNLNFGLADVVYEWARGVPFAEICQLTAVPEGSVVRSVTRLDELCREVRNAARVVGDPTLYRKMEATSALIKRDVIFCGSLYV
ncbi:unnamed protein product [Phaeothamnion confervicola]